MSETIENIKKFNIGDRVTSTHSILLDRGFRGVTGVIKTIVLDGRTWQYLIELDDGRELQCDDWHLEQPQLNDNQQIVLEWLKSETILTREAPILSVNAFSDKNLLGKLPDKVRKAYKLLTCKQEYEVLAAFAQWGMKEVTE